MPAHARSFCSQLARDAAAPEPLLGTAHPMAGVIAITWPRKLWGRQHFKSRGLPPGLVAELKRIQVTHRYFVRLISAEQSGNGVQVFVMPQNRRLAISDVVDLEAALRAAFATETPRLDDEDGWADNTVPLVLICTNGARDRCCAKHGFAAYKEALRRQRLEDLPAQIFQSTHLTGDRFAACALVLPSGDLYGWLRPENVAAFLSSAVVKGQVHWPLFRGNSYLSERDQILDGLVRQRFGREDLQWSFTPGDDGQLAAEVFQPGPTAKVVLGRVRLGPRERFMFVDCDALDRDEYESVSRTVVIDQTWLVVPAD